MTTQESPSNAKMFLGCLISSIVGTLIYSAGMIFTHSLMESVYSNIPSKSSEYIKVTNDLLTMTTLTPLNIEFTFGMIFIIGWFFFNYMRSKTFESPKKDVNN
jgi:hypothetical protein